MLLLVSALLLGATPQHFAIATAPYVYHFPRDHYAHDAYRTEWWYFTGHLRAPDGRRFGYELTFFRFGLEPRASHRTAQQSAWRAYQLYPAHFAISDIDGKRFFYSETLARDALGQGFAAQDALRVRANTWSLRGTGGARPRMTLRASSGSEAIDLVQEPLKPPAVHGRGGISRKGACGSCASHYYSFTRLRTLGTVTVAGMRFAVDGVSWMDHEFGSDELQRNQTGWDWFSLQLNDGRELMLYRLRQTDGSATPQSSGSLIAPSGAVTYLPLQAFTIRALGVWKSPHTQARYPSGWRITADGVAQPIDVVPLLDDQELADASGATYWEGDVEARDARSGAVIGEGYVELTGYASPLRL